MAYPRLISTKSDLKHLLKVDSEEKKDVDEGDAKSRDPTLENIKTRFCETIFQFEIYGAKKERKKEKGFFLRPDKRNRFLKCQKVSQK